MDWIELTGDRIHWDAFVKMVMNLFFFFCIHTGDLLSICCNIKLTEILINGPCLALLFISNIFLFSLLLIVAANRRLECACVSVDFCCTAHTMDHLLFIHSRHCCLVVFVLLRNVSPF